MHVPSQSQRTCPAAKRRAACFGARLKVLQRPWTSQHSRWEEGWHGPCSTKTHSLLERLDQPPKNESKQCCKAPPG